MGGICFFIRGGSKAFDMSLFGQFYIKSSLIFLKNGVVLFWNKYLVASSQKKLFMHSKNGKSSFCAKKMKAVELWHRLTF